MHEMTQGELVVAIKRARQVWIGARVTLDDIYWFHVSKRAAMLMVIDIRKPDGYRAVLKDGVLSIGD